MLRKLSQRLDWPSNIIKIDKKEIYKFYGLFAITAFVVYYLPYQVGQLYFLLFLALFIFSQRDYFWFAFIFLLINEPGTLFGGGSSISGISAAQTIPSFPIGKGIAFTFYDLFIIFALIKSFLFGKKTHLLLQKSILFLAFYLFIIFSFSYFQGNMNFTLLANYLRLFMTYSLLVSFPNLIKKKEDYFKIGYLLFPLIFFIVFTQFYTMFTGNWFRSIFTGASDFKFYRPTGLKGVEVFFILFLATLMIKLKINKKGQKYLFVVSIFCFLSFFLSATRSWIVVSFFFFLLNQIFVIRNFQRSLLKLIPILVLFAVFYFFVPIIQSTTDLAIKRTSTLGVLTKGGEIANQEYDMGRLTLRLPRIMKAIEESPIFGVGFGQRFQDIDPYTGGIYGDYHVGNFNLIANCGVIGFLFYLNYIFQYFQIILKTKKLINYNRDSLNILIISFFCLLILHFSSYQIFGYTIKQNLIYFLVFFTIFSEMIIKMVYSENNLIKNKVIHSVSQEHS